MVHSAVPVGEAVTTDSAQERYCITLSKRNAFSR